jgi:hypothetical protein
VTETFTRRRLLRLAGATSAAGVVGLNLGERPAVAQAPGPVLARRTTAVRNFVSRPDLKPPPITVRRYGRVEPSRHIFLNAPYTTPGHGGAIILNSHGELVWFGPNTATRHKMDVNVQTFAGQPVLTWWQGVSVLGHGEGEAVIADSSYQVKHVIRAVNGVRADLHEFNITAAGTALITAYRTHSGVDLSAVGGPSSGGYIFSGVVQEIDIATGNLLFEWDSYHPTSPPVGLSETYRTLSAGEGTQAQPFDYFHVNSVAPDADGNLLVSGRNTWTVYKISKADGSIAWRLNGKNSDFTVGTGAGFAWQHHVRPHGHGALTVFDNGAAVNVPSEPRSRALLLNVDTTAMGVTLAKAYTHPGSTPVLATAMGSAQPLPDGNMFVGWGTAQRFSEFSADGQLLLDGIMLRTAPSYRGFSKEWKGHPAERPAAGARYRTGGATVYASWNGATEVASWTVHAGRARTSLRGIGTARRTGFETAIAVSSTGPYFAVQANDIHGHALATSATVMIS